MNMKYIAYHRVSTTEQNLDRGINEITEYCEKNGIKLYKNKIYCDKQTGKNFERLQYAIIKNELLENGDVLLITEIDRLGRDKNATLAELRHFADNNIRLMCLELPTTLMNTEQMGDGIQKMMFDTINNMMIELFASMAHAEMQKRQKRQKEGISEMKKRGRP